MTQGAGSILLLLPQDETGALCHTSRPVAIPSGGLTTGALLHLLYDFYREPLPLDGSNDTSSFGQARTAAGKGQLLLGPVSAAGQPGGLGPGAVASTIGGAGGATALSAGHGTAGSGAAGSSALALAQAKPAVARALLSALKGSGGQVARGVLLGSRCAFEGLARATRDPSGTVYEVRIGC